MGNTYNVSWESYKFDSTKVPKYYLVKAETNWINLSIPDLSHINSKDRLNYLLEYLNIDSKGENGFESPLYNEDGEEYEEDYEDEEDCDDCDYCREEREEEEFYSKSDNGTVYYNLRDKNGKFLKKDK